jgi:hypothetical protein
MDIMGVPLGKLEHSTPMAAVAEWAPRPTAPCPARETRVMPKTQVWLMIVSVLSLSCQCCQRFPMQEQKPSLHMTTFGTIAPIRNKGTCLNYNLLGICTDWTCLYCHLQVQPTLERTKTVANKLKLTIQKFMKAIKD